MPLDFIIMKSDFIFNYFFPYLSINCFGTNAPFYITDAEREEIQWFKKEDQELTLPSLPDSPPSNYKRDTLYDKMIKERDVLIPMRDGVNLCVDIYRPDSDEKFPALLAFAIYNKEIQGLIFLKHYPRNRPGLQYGPVHWRQGTRNFLYPGAMCTSSAPRGVSASQRGEGPESGIPMTLSNGLQSSPDVTGM